MNKEIVKRMLTKKKLKQVEMARDLGISRQQLCDILSGRLQGWKYRSRICRYLGLREEELFQDD
jgi:DNA-binding XRE family transcriptional regulator